MIADKKCKTCRRAGEKLFLRGDRCFTPKCAFERKSYAPGKRDYERKHRSTVTEFGMQLREKQKIRNIYRVPEKQFARYVKESVSRSSGSPAELLYAELELRLDSAAYRAGFAASRAEARQIVSHGHILVNGRRVTVPSYRLREGDVLSVREGSAEKPIFARMKESGAGAAASSEGAVGVPSWILADAKEKTGTIVGIPRRETDQGGLSFKSVIEFYSR